MAGAFKPDFDLAKDFAAGWLQLKSAVHYFTGQAAEE